MNNNYIPAPIDTSDVILASELLELTEIIAENCHDLWSIGRLKEGWVFGETKNSEAKTTPCLVPYNELPESEKEYDRVSTMETLKLIVKLGYKITKE